MIKRKRRSDRNHIVYKITIKSKTYIGVTHVEKSNPIKSLRRRWQKHVQRAFKEDRDWTLCHAIREHGPEAFTVEIVTIIRGKSEAHEYERKLIRKLKPKLNTDIR